MYVCIQHVRATARVWRSEESFWKPVLSVHCGIWETTGQLVSPSSSFRLVGSIQCTGPTLTPSFPRDWGLLSFAVPALAMTSCL